MHSVVVYSRKGCHLCDVLKETLTKLQSAADFEWRDVDIDTDPDLVQRFNDEIPVVFINGRKAFKYRMTRDQFLQTLSAQPSR